MPLIIFYLHIHPLLSLHVFKCLFSKGILKVKNPHPKNASPAKMPDHKLYEVFQERETETIGNQVLCFRAGSQKMLINPK
jgi:hypothetical protein